MSWDRAILHVDMDAFFVNVHLLDHPQDAGLPIAVGGSPSGRGVVASASYEARRFGVHSAMPSARAKKLCPPLKFVGHNWPRIKECSQLVMDLLAEFGPIQPMSVDEAYVDVADYADPASTAVIIRERVRAETQLPASVGLATSKLVAKVASDFDKPQGCTIVRPGEEAAFLAPLSVRAIWGIGPRTAERLAEIGIRKCGELATADLSLLHRAFGRQAESLQRRARGIDRREVVTERGPAKSISQERTFSTDVDDAEFLHGKLTEMADTVSASLQRRGLMAHTVVIKFRWADFTTFTRQRTRDAAFDGAAAIAQQGKAILDEHWQGKKLRLLGIGVSNLVPAAGRQLTLFDLWAQHNNRSGDQ